MEPVVLVLIIVVVVVVLVALALVLRRNRAQAGLRERFGPEYDRVRARTGSEKAARERLGAVAERRDRLEIRELAPERRAELLEQWREVQGRFVDEPVPAVEAADVLVTSVMRERGYPVKDFEERATLLSADHPDVVDHYRQAHAAFDRHRAGDRPGREDAGVRRDGDAPGDEPDGRSRAGDTTEDLRQAFVHYRELFETLVGRDADRAPDRTPDRTPDRADVDSRDDQRVERVERVDRVDDGRTPDVGPSDAGTSDAGTRDAAAAEPRRLDSRN